MIDDSRWSVPGGLPVKDWGLNGDGQGIRGGHVVLDGGLCARNSSNPNVINRRQGRVESRDRAVTERGACTTYPPFQNVIS